jgi:hypothetical protein
VLRERIRDARRDGASHRPTHARTRAHSDPGSNGTHAMEARAADEEEG